MEINEEQLDKKLQFQEFRSLGHIDRQDEAGALREHPRFLSVAQQVLARREAGLWCHYIVFKIYERLKWFVFLSSDLRISTKLQIRYSLPVLCLQIRGLH